MIATTTANAIPEPADLTFDDIINIYEYQNCVRSAEMWGAEPRSCAYDREGFDRGKLLARRYVVQRTRKNYSAHADVTWRKDAVCRAILNFHRPDHILMWYALHVFERGTAPAEDAD